MFNVQGAHPTPEGIAPDTNMDQTAEDTSSGPALNPVPGTSHGNDNSNNSKDTGVNQGYFTDEYIREKAEYLGYDANNLSQVDVQNVENITVYANGSAVHSNFASSLTPPPDALQRAVDELNLGELDLETSYDDAFDAIASVDLPFSRAYTPSEIDAIDNLAKQFLGPDA